MTTGDPPEPAGPPRPIPLTYARPSDRRPVARLPHPAASSDRAAVPSPSGGSREPRPDDRPTGVRPGPLFGLTVVGLFVLLAFAVVVIVTVVGR